LIYHVLVPDIAALRLSNALALFDEFVHNTVAHPDAATLRGLEGRFAQLVQIQPSYWSQIKSRSRHIGEKLARQFEVRCHKPYGWMDQAHDAAPVERREHVRAQDEDERFIVGLVLTYYRRDPQRAKARLLHMLGEVLQDPAQSNLPAATQPTHPNLRTQKTVVALKKRN
jgi:hypothetical protein